MPNTGTTSTNKAGTIIEMFDCTQCYIWYYLNLQLITDDVL